METSLLKNIPINVDNSLNIYIFFYLVFAGAALIGIRGPFFSSVFRQRLEHIRLNIYLMVINGSIFLSFIAVFHFFNEKATKINFISSVFQYQFQCDPSSFSFLYSPLTSERKRGQTRPQNKMASNMQNRQLSAVITQKLFQILHF